ncbi:MAG: hypothetical protein ABEK59_08840 [Halobacteria archaeon]
MFLDEADSLCLPPDTEVTVGRPENTETKKIQNVSTDGEDIPSVDFNTNHLQSDRGRLVDSGVADFFTLKLSDGRTVTASHRHPFFTVGDGNRLVEKKLIELDTGDEIADYRRNLNRAGGPTGAKTASDGGLPEPDKVEITAIEYSHLGKAYNITMEETPNFALGNGVLTHNTRDAQPALRRTMEMYTNTCRFILSCNYSSNIIDPIQSRCAVFRFSGVDDDEIVERLREISKNEEVEVTEDGLEALAYVAGGDVRKAVNALQASAALGDRVDEDTVFSTTSTARSEEVEEMLNKALQGEFKDSRRELESMIEDKGISGGDLIDQMHRTITDLDIPERKMIEIMDRIGETDYRISTGGDEKIQLEAFLASLAK